MKNSRLQLVSLLFLALLLSSIQGVIAQGTTFTYQGRLDDNGGPANGSYDFRFRLSADSLGNVFVGAPVLANALSVTGGLFTVSLDFGAVFTGSNYWVQVDVKTNGAGAYTTLIPLQKVMPTPYSIMANSASNLLGTLPTAQLSGTVGNSQLANDAVTSAKILDGTISSADLGPNSVNTTHIVDGQVANADLANDAVNSAKVLDASLVGADLANNTVTSLQLADNISLGDGVLDGQLHVYNTSLGGPAISLFGTGTGGFQYLYQDDGQVGIYLDGDSGGGGLQYLYAADGSVGITLNGNSGGAGLIGIQNTNGSSRILLDGAGSGSGGSVSVYAQDGSLTVQLFGESTGAGLINVNNNVSSPRVVIDGEGNGTGGQISLFNASGANGINLYGDSGGGGLQYIYAADGSIGISLDGDSGGAGLISIRNTNSSSRIILDGFSSFSGGEISVYDSNGSESVELLGATSATLGGKISVKQNDASVGVEIIAETYAGDGGIVSVKNAAGAERMELDGDDGDGGAVIRLHNGAGTTTITLDADVGVSGGGRVGIGRSPAVNALEVAGNASKDVAGSWLANSDRRIKEDVRPLDNALETINRVRPVGFRYTGEYLAQHPTTRNVEYFNVIAQEFAEVFPASVQAGGDKLSNGESVLQVDTYPATVYSIAAIQELDRKLKARDARVAELEQDVAELKSLLQTMLQKSNKGAQ